MSEEEEGIIANANAFVYIFARGRLLCCLLTRQTMRLVTSKAWRFGHARRHWHATARSAQGPAPERDRETVVLLTAIRFPKTTCHGPEWPIDNAHSFIRRRKTIVAVSQARASQDEVYGELSTVAARPRALRWLNSCRRPGQDLGILGFRGTKKSQGVTLEELFTAPKTHPTHPIR